MLFAENKLHNRHSVTVDVKVSLAGCSVQKWTNGRVVYKRVADIALVCVNMDHAFSVRYR